MPSERQRRLLHSPSSSSPVVLPFLLLAFLLLHNCATEAFFFPSSRIHRPQALLSLPTRTFPSPRTTTSIISTSMTTASTTSSSNTNPPPTPPSSSSSSFFKQTFLHSFQLLGKSTRWTVASLVGIVLLVRRDAAIVNFTMGAILNAILGKTLKRCIKEARPDGAVLDDHGMPSSHAMALFYMTAFITKALIEGKGVGLPGWWPLDYIATIAVGVVYIAVASSWRVYSGLHTGAQIGVGACVGSVVGAAWQHFCQKDLNGRLGSVLLQHYPPEGRVPLVYVGGVMVIGALTVGSVERKIAKAMKKIIVYSGKKREE